METMLQKWKPIINNWINCYFDEHEVRHVNTDSLLVIISHLRENLSLNESKSSVLEAHTVEEFILEKYPDFKFKNGTVKANNEDDIYLVASLLLFFVCVNSKDMDLKSAMCSKLSGNDQEIIMKFSKNLMECSLITCEDIEIAITEACGNEMANLDTGHMRVAVAETPPALRSLHGEVRRLQAALDAERFDRNFLQEELARTNLRLEKLTKDKEQYKLDIRNLKTKVSQCSRGDHDAMQAESNEKLSAKLERQLQDMEERLIRTQEQLDEAVHDRDSFKTKLEGLKQDRDKWLSLSQQESARAVQLSEELDMERRQMQSLKELVIELRQHNRLNRLDSSLLECDDPDASIQSIGHNLSVCSEACVNVIEVQLGEERARVDALKQQVISLQKENEQLHSTIEEVNSKYEVILKEKDCIIETLEQELKTQNTLLETLQKDHKDVTLSWEEHKLKTREIIEVKDERIQKLNEHLGSLKQEFLDLENVNKELTEKVNIMLQDAAYREKIYSDKLLEENSAKELLLKDKECLVTENNLLKQNVSEQKSVQEMLLNDKQLLTLEKQSLIEALDVKQSEHEEIEKKIQVKLEEVRELYKQITLTLNVGINKLLEDFRKENFTKKIIQNLLQNFEGNKTSYVDKCDLLINIANTLHTTMIAKKKALHHNNATMKSLREADKQKEHQIFELQNENKQLQQIVEESKIELSKQNETNARSLHTKLVEVQSLQQENQNLTNELNTVKVQMEVKVHSLKEKLVDYENETDELKKGYECQIENLNVMITKLTENLKEKTGEVHLAVQEKERLQQTVAENSKIVKCLEDNLKTNVEKLERVTNEFESEKLVLQNMVTVTESVMEDQKVSLSNTIADLMNENKQLQDDNSAIKQQIENEKKEFYLLIQAKVADLELMKIELVNLKNLKEVLEKEKEALNNAVLENINEKKQLQNEICTIEQQIKNENNEFNLLIQAKELDLELMKKELIDLRLRNEVIDKERETLNNDIAQLFKEKKLLEDENNTIMQLMEYQKKEFKTLTQARDTNLEMLNKELIDLKLVNEILEKEKEKTHKQVMSLETEFKEKVMSLENDFQTQMMSLHTEIDKKENKVIKLNKEHDALESVLNQEISLLKTNIHNKEEELKNVLEEKKTLETTIRNYEDKIFVSLEKQNGELKIKIDTLEKEHHSKVDTICVSLQKEIENKKCLQIELKEKAETTLNMENKLRHIEEELTTLKQVHNELVEEKDTALNKINELETNLMKNAEEIKNINDYNMTLKEESDKLKQNKSELELDVAKLNTYNVELQQDINKIKNEKAECEKTIAVLNTQVKELQQNIVMLNTTNSDLQENLVNLKNANSELQYNNVKLNKDITKKEKVMNILNKTNNDLAGEINKLKDEYKEISNNFIVEKTVREKQNEQISSTLNVGLAKLIQDIRREAIVNESLQQLIHFENNDTTAVEKCGKLINIANIVAAEAIMKRNLEKALEQESTALIESKKMLQQKEMHILELQSEIKRLQHIVNENKIELSKQSEMNTTALDNKLREIQMLQQNNSSLTNDLNDVKIQLEVKVHSLKEKLVDNENLTDKLKKTYECQIDNLNIMITKLSNYLKDKSMELDGVRKEKDRLQQVIEINNKAIKTLEEEVKTEKLNQEKLMNDFESEREVIKNMVAVTESVMADQKMMFNTNISEKEKTIEMVQAENKSINQERNELEQELRKKETSLELIQKELVDLQNVKDNLEKDMKSLKTTLENEILALKTEIQNKEDENMTIKEENRQLEIINKNYKDSAVSLANQNSELKIKKDAIEVEFIDKVEKLTESLQEQIDNKKDLNIELNEKTRSISKLERTLLDLEKKLHGLEQEKGDWVTEKDGYLTKVKEIRTELENNKLKSSDEINKLTNDKKELIEGNDKLKKRSTELEEEFNHSMKLVTELKDQIAKLQNENTLLSEEINKLRNKNAKLLEEVAKLTNNNVEMHDAFEKKKVEMQSFEGTIKREQEQWRKVQDDLLNEKVTLANKCDILETYHTKAETELAERQKEIVSLQKEVQTLQAKVELCVNESVAKDGIISKMSKEKDILINDINKELQEEKELRAKYQKDLEEKASTICVLKKKLDELNTEREALKILKKENEELIKAVGHRETFAVRSYENASTRKYSGPLAEKELRDLHHQVDNTSDITHSSIESLKTITDLEKIIHDKNRTITALQSDITYLKTLMGESETKLLDVNKELELSKENCYQLSTQLKKIVYQKNEEIADLKKQVTKMSVAENRATQIIKVSAKYQAIILKRIAEIKSNTILKELTNFGNSNTICDNEVRRSLNAGAITMEDLENFLETTEKHLKKCSEKQLVLQKEKDRMTEVNRIYESENINIKKFLTELSVRFQTFSSVKDLYAQKLSRVISVQRTVRREILNVEGYVTEKCMLKLERGYAAVMQDLAECIMNFERWVEKSIGRTISAEKIKQAVLQEDERSSLAPSTIQNTGLEVQLDELVNSFQKLLEEVSRAPKGEDAKDAQATTLMEVRAEYEDKLSRMKAKMKQLYTEQIAVFKEKQKKEIAMLERELSRARDTLSQSSRAYEDHIRGLTTELWSVGEKFLVQKDEAKYLRRKQQSGSLMSLQHVHSSGLVPSQEVFGRPSDTQSLRSIPATNNGGTKREGRELHMSDEEGEVFDNRYLQELATPRRAGRESGAPERLSELRWRNSLCPPHLKSSYPAETQFTHTIDEEEIKAMGGPSAVVGRQQRKEVGITAYKKPGPPTPSKQAGRLSATDSELRESLRVEADPQPSRKTTTPSRIRNLFRSSKPDHSTEGTPRSRRLSNIFRKK